jgi:hypothetical protein
MSTRLESAAAVLEAASRGVPEPEPNLFRFGLRRLFFFLSMAVVLAAIMARMGGAWPIIIGSGVALVAAHVLGTFLGTRLRDTSSAVQRWKARPGSVDHDEPVALPQPVCIAELRLPEIDLLLAGHERIGRLRYWPTVTGAVAGALLGGMIIGWALVNDVTWPGLVLGSVSCSVIGAWAGWLGANFWVISRHALRQATNEHRA